MMTFLIGITLIFTVINMIVNILLLDVLKDKIKAIYSVSLDTNIQFNKAVRRHD